MNVISLIVGLILNSFIILYTQPQSPYIICLGITQDGGYPHMGCEKQCCTKAWKDISKRRFVVSLALVDPVEKKWWLFEATPDIREQLQLFRTLTKKEYAYLPDGIFLTHAHIGHYTGLMQLGREVMNTQNIPVYAMPRLKQFLETNGPWSQLVTLKNIILGEIKEGAMVHLTEWTWVQAFTVPHRDEYSETAGFKIHIKNKTYLFIPDVDKWSKWNKDIVDMVKQVDVAFVDGTFSEASELPNRKMEEVPHPLVSETMSMFEKESPEVKSKIEFVHFNHTNPLLWSNEKRKEILKIGFGLAEQGKKY